VGFLETGGRIEKLLTQFVDVPHPQSRKSESRKWEPAKRSKTAVVINSYVFNKLFCYKSVHTL